MASAFDVTQQVQSDPVEGEFKVPVLPTAIAVVVFSNDAANFASDLIAMMREEGPKPYEVISHNVSQEVSNETLFYDIRRSLKVLVIFSMEMVDVKKQRLRLIKELRIVEGLIAERHMECLIPIYHDIDPQSEDIPDAVRYSCALPAGHAANFVIANESNLDRIMKMIAEHVPIASSGSHGAAYGIAWTYFFGWLYLVLKELRERIITTARETHKDWNIERRFELFPKLIVIIPKNGYNIATLSAYDPTVQPVLSKTKMMKDGFSEPIKAIYTQDTLAQPNRDYSTPLFKTSHKNKTYVFAAEVPTCLRTLKEMADPDSDYVPEFNVIDHHRELHVFMGQLNRILNIKTKTDKFAHIRRQTVCIIFFDDEHDSLSEVIANTIEDDIKWQSSENPWSMASVKEAISGL